MKKRTVLKKAAAFLLAAGLLVSGIPTGVLAGEAQTEEEQISEQQEAAEPQTKEGVTLDSGEPETALADSEGTAVSSEAENSGGAEASSEAESAEGAGAASDAEEAEGADGSPDAEDPESADSSAEAEVSGSAEATVEPENPEEAEVTAEAEDPEEDAAGSEEEEAPRLTYQAHVQNYGWMDPVSDGYAGTEGEALRMEAVRIKIEGTSLTGDVEYRAHVQDYGWMDPATDNGLAGTTAEKKRMEAIQIRLTGELAEKYDIYYRVHVQYFGWLGWAKNWEKAGSSHYAYRMEAIEICLVAKGGQVPGSTGDSYRYPMVQYQAHVQDYGWMGWVTDGATAGTTGKTKRMEAIQIRLPEQPCSGSVEYRAHVQNEGWQGWKSNGALGGTSGKKLRMEAVEIRLTGEMAQNYDIYYRAHVSNFGWLGWAKNGEKAGSESYALQMEALEIRLVEKGGEAPGAAGDSYRCPPVIQSQVHAQDYGWMSWVSSGASAATAGTTGQSKRLEAIRIQIPDQQYSGEIQYRAHVQDIGWQDWVSSGELSGTTAQGKRMEAIQIRLTGELAEHYDVYYRTHVQSYGWLGWAKNGASAGTAKQAYRMEAIQIRLQHKEAAAPGSSSGAFKDGKNGWYYENGFKFYYKNNVKQTDVRSLIGAQSSYVIRINKAQSCVTVYAKDGNNGYIIPAVAFACSPGSATPIGTFRTSNVKHRWHYLFGSRGQWTTQITGDILFHSLPYTTFDNRTMFPGEYNKLGSWASAGCVRLRAIDAKWIYDNIPAGTQVTIYNSSDPGPLGKPVYAKIPADQRWDPTDPYL